MPKPDWNKKYTPGKGSWRRPEDSDRFRENWDRIFGDGDAESDEKSTTVVNVVVEIDARDSISRWIRTSEGEQQVIDMLKRHPPPREEEAQ